jgi:hypothetical protein
MERRDYLAWHDDYERPGSALHLRLLVVQDLIAAALDEAEPGAIRVLSICAGQGRDLVTVAGDAGRMDWYVGATPADVVLACGIFGNLTDEEVHTMVELMPALCAPGARVIWTRVPRSDGILVTIQDWFDDAGFEPRALIVGEGELFGVGAARFCGTPTPIDPDSRLFGDFFR